MTYRHKKIVLEAEEGITFKVSNSNGVLVIRAFNSGEGEVYKSLPAVQAGEYAEELSVYTDKDGNQAVVPTGWTVSKVEKENTIWGKDVSLVIYRIPKDLTISLDWESELETLKRTCSQFVWVPVRFLEANGTLDGENFTEKFGRRNYKNNEFWKVEFDDFEFNEPLKDELLQQVESVKKYGGFYISRYNISERKADQLPQSVKGVMPLVDIDLPEAISLASIIVDNTTAKSHLTYGAEYDSILEWLIESECKNIAQIEEDSTNWGKYCDTKNFPNGVVGTGSCGEWEANNICDLAGNVDEWTQEQWGEWCYTIRGGSCNHTGSVCPVAYRDNENPDNWYDSTGFRAALYIK